MCQKKLIVAASGEVLSPNFPESYDKSTDTHDCELRIETPDYPFVNLTFVWFDVEKTKNCYSDYVRIQAGGNTWTGCGTTPPLVGIVNASEVYVRFKTEPGKTYAKGFRMLFQGTKPGM